MKVAAIVVAAGRGDRAGGSIPKQYRDLGGIPVVRRAIEALAGAGADPVICVTDPEHAALFTRAAGPVAHRVDGGATRTASVRNGLSALANAAPDVVLIHDAARPGLDKALVNRLIAAIGPGAGAAPALPGADALKRIDANGYVAADVSRDGVMRIQTPQAFRYAAIVDAYARTPADSVFDDDVAVARAAGYSVTTVAGDPRLMKLTYPEDFDILERLLSETISTPAQAGLVCVGTGFDAHRFGDGDHVTLCGVRIAHRKGLIGHSDADAGWHALTDAILGALALGDIGDHFPPSDPQWKGADSAKFLAHAAKLAAAAGATISNVDITLICERPKIAPHRDAMRARTAEVLGLPLTRVSVKATTTERMGFLGREEGLAAQASATLLRTQS